MSFRMVHLWFSNKKYMVNWHLASLLIEKTKICISGETIPIIFPEKTNAMTLEFTSISNFYHFPFFVMTTIQIIWKLMRLTNNFHFHLRFIVFLCISLSKIHHHVKREAQSKRFLTYGLLQDKWESNKVVTQEWLQTLQPTEDYELFMEAFDDSSLVPKADVLHEHSTITSSSFFNLLFLLYQHDNQAGIGLIITEKKQLY